MHASPPAQAPCVVATWRRHRRCRAHTAACCAAGDRHAPPPPALLVSLATDDACTGGVALQQSALADAFADAVRDGTVVCDPGSLGAGVTAQAAAGRDLFLQCGVTTRGSQRPAGAYFVRTPGLPPLAEGALLERLHTAASRALHAWTQRGGSGARGVTHLVVGSLTPARSAPGVWVALHCAFPWPVCACSFWRRSSLSACCCAHCHAGPDIALVSRLGLSAAVRRVPCHHLGDHGGLRALALAAQIARGDPRVRAT